MALDILGAVVPGPWPPPSRSPRSADGAPEWVLPPEGDGKLPTAGALTLVPVQRLMRWILKSCCAQRYPCQAPGRLPRSAEGSKVYFASGGHTGNHELHARICANKPAVVTAANDLYTSNCNNLLPGCASYDEDAISRQAPFYTAWAHYAPTQLCSGYTWTNPGFTLVIPKACNNSLPWLCKVGYSSSRKLWSCRALPVVGANDKYICKCLQDGAKVA